MRSVTGFPDGFKVVYDKQEYWPVGTEPYTTLEGKDVTLVRWATQCPTCGVGFTITTALELQIVRRPTAPGKARS